MNLNLPRFFSVATFPNNFEPKQQKIKKFSAKLQDPIRKKKKSPGFAQRLSAYPKDL